MKDIRVTVRVEIIDRHMHDQYRHVEAVFEQSVEVRTHGEVHVYCERAEDALEIANSLVQPSMAAVYGDQREQACTEPHAL